MLTPLNLEQSIARYLADNFKNKGFNIKWFDTSQTESVSGSQTVTILREFPESAINFARQDEGTGPGIVNVPAFTVFARSPRTNDSLRIGIGESIFEWDANVRIDGFADTELQWYQFSGWFKDWFSHPDILINLYDYESDLSSANPTAAEEKIRVSDVDVVRRELDERPAVRYYLNVSITSLFIE